MAHCELASKPLLQCLRQTYRKGFSVAQLQAARPFSSTIIAREEAQTEAPKQHFYDAPNPALVTSPKLERRLVRAGTPPIGSRRRRAALQTAPNIPFEQLPYQCFQEARKLLLEDREQKLKEIEVERARLARLRETTTANPEEEAQKQTRIRSMERRLEKLKIYADINDPIVKRRFEDGLGMAPFCNFQWPG